MQCIRATFKNAQGENICRKIQAIQNKTLILLFFLLLVKNNVHRVRSVQ